MTRRPRLAVAHWSEQVDGGGERVAWETARTFDAPLLVGFRNEAVEPADVEVKAVFGERLRQLAERGGAVGELAQYLGWQGPEGDALREYDTLITTSNEVLYHVGKPEQTHVHYAHHTQRHQTDRFESFEAGVKGRLSRVYQDLRRLQMKDAASRPDVVVANSDVVARRVLKYWPIPEDRLRIVYPPVETGELDPDAEQTQDYYLSVTRLVDHKRVEEIVRAFTRQGHHRLLVASDGPERERLEAIAGDNVEFLGYVSEERKRELLAGAKAFVFAAEEEDFGMAPVEAMAAGTPVLGVREGMTRHQVLDGENGYTFVRAGEDGPTLSDAVERFEREGISWDADRIAAFADRFSVDAFREGMREAVRTARERAAVTPAWTEEP